MNSPRDEPWILELDSAAATLGSVGGKGASLARLAAAGLPAPPGFHITTHAYRRFVSENNLANAIISAAGHAMASDPASLDTASAQIQAQMARGAIPVEIADAIREWYGKLGSGDLAVAVRSSATAEDLPEMSFAGQQDTYLNVRGSEHVLEAVKRCWASLWTARALGYRARQGIRPEDVALAVVVQELVPADVAGILFTANPRTGARGEIMITASWGLGEAIVGGQVTPDTFVVDKHTGALASREIAAKDVMTVRLADGTGEESVPAERRRQPALAPAEAAELARLGVQIEQLYGQPMDIEWALHDGRIFTLQARPVTALPEPPATLDWPLPQPGGKYGRASVIELLPDPLSPLFATLALPLWNDRYHRLMGLIGFERVVTQDFLLTINDYAYYDYSGFTGVRMLLALPRLILVAPGWMRRAHARWADEARPRYAAAVTAWTARDIRTTPAAHLLEGAREIAGAEADHYLTIQSGILPVAYMTEWFFTSFYERLIKHRDDPPALTFLLGFDSAPILAEKSLFDLAAWALSQGELAGYLGRTTSAEIAAAYQSSAVPISDAVSWSEFRHRFADHLDRFGHAIYDLDFAKALAADEPAPLLETLKFFLTGTARSPHERQGAATSAREQAVESLLARLKGLRRRWFTSLVRRAQRYAPLREDALASVGLGWPLLRRMLHEVGRRLVAGGAITAHQDVFWLKDDEITTAARALDSGNTPADFHNIVAQRRATWSRERKVTPPVVLPIKGGARFFGMDWSEWMPARTGQAHGDTIKGIGASPGRVAGTARVLQGPGEFHQMHQGEILVAKITTPAWTPLFALATGVVTDVGGPLSHSSIVAREYQIPAVLGTGIATERIQSGQPITVDGDAGVVTISR
jgi:pyruvate,water dikinase